MDSMKHILLIVRTDVAPGIEGPQIWTLQRNVGVE